MEYVQGRVFLDPSLPEVKSKQERFAIYQAMIQVLADLHSVDIDKIGLSKLRRKPKPGRVPRSYAERQLTRWKRQFEASRTGEETEQTDKLVARYHVQYFVAIYPRPRRVRIARQHTYASDDTRKNNE
jgi:aminoglycoside phosphotransferase (APT) family kinase protein